MYIYIYAEPKSGFFVVVSKKKCMSQFERIFSYSVRENPSKSMKTVTMHSIDDVSGMTNTCIKRIFPSFFVMLP